MADSDLARTHPATVAVRSVKAMRQAIFGFFALAILGLSNRDSALVWFGVAALLVVSAAIATAFSWLNWLFFRFGIVGDHLVITEGLLVKKHRSIPLARIQGVDIRADVVSRLMGLADVMVQTAGGGEGEAEARIGSIPLKDAEKLRTLLSAGSRLHPLPVGEVTAGGDGVAVSAGGDAVGPAATTIASAVVGADPLGRMSDFRGALGGARALEPEPVFEHRLSISRLALAGITSNAPIAAVAISVGLAAQTMEFIGNGRSDAVGSTLSALAVPALVALGLAAFVVVGVIAVTVTISRDFGFTVRRTHDRLETEAGLLERRMTSVPVRRIQAVIIESTPVRRLLKLGALQILTAGFGKGEDKQKTTSSALVPIARTREIRPLLHSLLPEVDLFPHTGPVPRRALRFYLLWPTSVAAAATLAIVGMPLALIARSGISEGLAVAAPFIVAVSVTVVAGVVATSRALSWHSSGFGVEGNAIAVAYGVLGAYKARIPRSRIQSLTIRQSPFQRRAGLATLVVSSVSGSSQKLFRVLHLELADAARIEQWYSPDAQSAPAARPETSTS